MIRTPAHIIMSLYASFYYISIALKGLTNPCTHTSHWINVVLMLAQRLRRRARIKKKLVQFLVLEVRRPRGEHCFLYPANIEIVATSFQCWANVETNDNHDNNPTRMDALLPLMAAHVQNMNRFPFFLLSDRPTGSVAAVQQCRIDAPHHIECSQASVWWGSASQPIT